MARLESLPLFHRIAGQPVVVLGEGPAAEPKRRLVERAGGEVIGDLAEGIDRGARIAFIAHEDAAMCEADAIRARGAGLLVNVVDRPALCDFTTPSLLERGPLILAVGTGGASAGLAKQLRLRLERMLPHSLGLLAERLSLAREALRRRYPDAAVRRRALDAALDEGGALDPLDPGSAARVEGWLAAPAAPVPCGRHLICLTSDDPEDLTLRQARLLGTADALVAGPGIAPAILARARADARRLTPEAGLAGVEGVIVELRGPGEVTAS